MADPQPPAAFRPAPPADYPSPDPTLGDSARRPPRASGLSVPPTGLGLADPASQPRPSPQHRRLQGTPLCRTVAGRAQEETGQRSGYFPWVPGCVRGLCPLRRDTGPTPGPPLCRGSHQQLLGSGRAGGPRALGGPSTAARMSPERPPTCAGWRPQRARPVELGPEPGQVPPLSGSPKVSLHQASEDSGASEALGRQGSARAQWVRTRSHLLPSDGEAWISRLREGSSTCIAGGLDPGEPNGAWGEFKGFRESSARSEQFPQPSELRDRPTAPQLPRTTSAQKEHGSHQPPQGGPWVTGTTVISPSEPILGYENVFRFAFREAPVQQATADVCSLDCFLEMSSGEKPGRGSVPECLESRKFWRALQNADSTSTSRRLWSGSRCQEHLLLVLRVDAAQNLSRNRGHILEDSELKEPEEVGVRGFRLHCCRALIQTKLSGTLGGRQGHPITYSLSLQTPPPATAGAPQRPRERFAVTVT